MTAPRRLRAPMLRFLQHSVFQALFLGGTLLGAVGCSDDSGPDGVVRTSSGGSGAGTQSETGGATGSNGSGGATATASGGSTQASTASASSGSTASGGSTSSVGGDSTRSGGTTAMGGTQASGGASGGQSSDGTRSSSAQSSGGQSSGGQGSAGRSSSAQSSGGQGSAGRTSSAQSSGGQSSGGTRASSSQGSGGSTGGSGGTSSTSASTGNPNTIGPNKTCGCLTSSGNYSGNPLTASIVVDAGETYDGGCKTYTTKSLASGGLGDGSQEEDQKPLFRVNGGKLMNVILGAPAADGVHFHGTATAQNIHWLDIGEDASTIKADATVTLDCGSAKNGSDKVFQVNAKATWTISNFTIKSAGKTMRENGDKCYPINAIFDHCDISDMKEVIFRTDCTSSKITISNTRYSGLGDGLVLVGDKIYNSSSGNVTITNVQKY